MGGSIEPPFLLPQEDRTTGQTARHSTLLTSFAHPDQKAGSAALSTPTNTQETNNTTRDHHDEPHRLNSRHHNSPYDRIEFATNLNNHVEQNRTTTGQIDRTNGVSFSLQLTHAINLWRDHSLDHPSTNHQRVTPTGYSW